MNELNLYNIDKNIGGEKLNSDLIHSFESAFIKFKEDFDPNSSESKKQLDEILKLLSLSDENLEKLKNQKWFKRVWNTIVGENKKLERIDKQNLLRVQKGSIYFLLKLTQQNPLIMQSVYFALKDVQNIKFQNARFKKYISEIFDEVSTRILKIENRLDKHTQVIDEIKSKNIPHLGLFFSCLFLISSSITLLFVFERNWIICVGSILLFLFGILLLIGSFSKDEDKDIESNDIKKTNIVNLENEKIKPELKKNLSEVIFNIFENDTLYFPILPLIENYTKISDLLEPLSKESGMKTEELAEIINNTLQISPEFKQEIIDNCSKTADEYVNLINEVITNIVKSYLPTSIGIELKTHIDYSKRNETNQEILSIIQPYFEKLKELESIRIELINDFQKYRKILTRSGWVDFGRGFGKGFILTALLGPIGFIGALIWIIISGENAEEIVENFANKYENYISEWEKLLSIIEKSIHPFLQNVTKSFVSEAIHDMDIIFNEFSKHNISLTLLNDEILEVLDEQSKSLENN